MLRIFGFEARPLSLHVIQILIPNADEVMLSEEEIFRTVERDGYYVIKPILPELPWWRRDCEKRSKNYPYT